MRLYVTRHAWAGDFGDPKYPDDRLRPLTAEGIARFRKAAKRLIAAGFDATLIATSPLVRCRETAEILAAESPQKPELFVLDDLAPGARLDPLVAWTQRQRCESVAWVGHAPDVGELSSRLIGATGGNLRFAKGTTAAIEFAREFGPCRGELIWLATAKVLGV